MVAPVTIAPESAIQLVHSVLILWDHYTPAVQEHAREMLVHLIHELVTSKIDETDLAASRTQIEQLVEAVRRNDPSVVWSYEDSNGKDDDGGGNRVPASMSNLTGKVVELFSKAYRDFHDLWAKEALHWASTCPVRHLACRSFQVFRCISMALDLRMLADMLARLSNTISDEQTDYQTFSMEILTTLKVIIHELDSHDVMGYTQLFWTTCACLNTIHESEFSESLGMLEKLLDRLDLGDPRTVRILLEAQPSRWEGGFEGLQPLVYKGLKSTDSLDRTLSLLNRLTSLPNNDLVGDSSRVLHTVLANMPHFLHQFDLQRPEQTSLSGAMQLAKMADRQGFASIAESLLYFANGQYRTSNDFLRSAMAAIRSCFFPDYDRESLVFLMGFLTNKTTWFKLKTMNILCVLIPEVDMRQPGVTRHGPDLISPLLRLLQTDLCPQALEVMDHIMEVSGNPLERHHIRMSLTSGSARAIRKEYERTESLYGIPLSSGWSIPMPAAFSSLTRNNVHAVFYTCGDAETMQRDESPDSEVEFKAEEGYLEPDLPRRRTNTMKSVDTVPDTNMNDLLHKLDSLDDFFDEPHTAPESVHHTPFASPDLVDTSTVTYDQQTAPILKKSLARTASTSSIQNGLAESRPSTSHQTGVLASTGVNTTPVTGGLDYSTLPLPPLPPTNGSARPTPPSRTFTSPAHDLCATQPSTAPPIPNLSNGGGSFLAEVEDDESGEDATFSDTESVPFPPLNTQVSPGLYSQDVWNNDAATSGSLSASGHLGPGIASGGGNLSNSSSSTLTKRAAGPASATAAPAASSSSGGSGGNAGVGAAGGETNGAFSFGGVKRGMRRLTTAKVDRDRDKDRIRELARLRAMSSGANVAAAAAGAGGHAGGGVIGVGSGHGSAGDGASGGNGSNSPKVPRVPVEYLSNKLIHAVGSRATSPGT